MLNALLCIYKYECMVYIYTYILIHVHTCWSSQFMKWTKLQDCQAPPNCVTASEKGRGAKNQGVGRHGFLQQLQIVNKVQKNFEIPSECHKKSRISVFGAFVAFLSGVLIMKNSHSI